MAILSLLLSGCSVAVRAPRSAFSMVAAADRQGMEVEYAYNSTVVHLPGLTWSVSGSYAPGAGQPVTPVMPATYAYAFPGAWSLTVRQPSDCRPTAAGRQRLSRALDRLFRSSGGMPARGSVSLTVFSRSAGIRRYVVALRTGRRYALSFAMRCGGLTGDEALWRASIIALHESTHASLELAGEQPQGNDRERVAIGAGACLLWSLTEGDPDFLREHRVLGEDIAERYQLSDERRPLDDWCGLWMAYVEAIPRVPAGLKGTWRTRHP